MPKYNTDDFAISSDEKNSNQKILLKKILMNNILVKNNVLFERSI